MSVDFGFALLEQHPPTPKLTQWMDDLDVILPQLSGHFQSLWMTDHFFWGEKYAYEVWTVMSYLAAKWEQFDIGSMVMGQNYRNPALLAKMASTLQVLSKGRLLLGVGAGWKEDEYSAYNYPFPTARTRIEQLEDTLEIIKRLWTHPGKVTHIGKHYAVYDAILEPKPDPVPPIIVGGGGERTLGVTARHADWWNLSDANLQKYTERMSVLYQQCEKIGRDPSSIRLTWFGRVVVGKDQADIQKVVGTRDMPWTRENAFYGTPPEIVEQMLAFKAKGVDYFMIDILGLPDEERAGIVIEEIIPKVRSL